MRRLWGPVVALAVLGAACGGEAPAPEAGEGARGEVSEQEARFGATLWQVRGHHVVSLELYRAGDRDGALAHASHPVDEVLAAVEGEVGERDAGAAARLRSAVERVRDAVRGGGASEEVEALFREAAAVLEEAERAVVGTPSPAYRGSVVAGLLSAAAHEYEEATPGGAVTELLEYQDAYGFLVTARQLYAELASGIERSAPEEAAEIEEALARLEEALPGLEPPSSPIPAEDVENLAAVVAHELEETVGAVVAVRVEAEEVWENIDALLDQAVAEYREGEPEEAAELAARAYLENYELVEGEVIEHAPDLNRRLEPLLSAQLRASIREGVPPEELERLVAQARELLEQARRAVEGGS